MYCVSVIDPLGANYLASASSRLNILVLGPLPGIQVVVEMPTEDRLSAKNTFRTGRHFSAGLLLVGRCIKVLPS